MTSWEKKTSSGVVATEPPRIQQFVPPGMGNPGSSLVPALLRGVAPGAPATKGSPNLPPHRSPEALADKKPQGLGFQQLSDPRSGTGGRCL